MISRTISRSEADQSAAGLHWSESQSNWLPADSPEAEAEEAAELHRVSSSSNATTVAGTATPVEKDGANSTLAAKHAESDVIWLEWDGPDDQGNPYNWPQFKKWMVVVIVCSYTICVSFAAGSIASGNKTMMRDLNCSHELAVMALAGFPLGFSFGPLALAPFSEVYGRFYVYVCSSVLFVIFLVPIARAENISTVIVFRIFLGVVGSTGSTLVGGTISDMFGDKDRGLAMGIFSVASISGTGLGPMTMGFVADAWGWRGIAYVQMTFAGVLAVLICCFTRETRGSVLLSRRAAKLRKDTGSDRYQVRSDAERASLAIMVKTSLTRPLYLLFTEPAVAALSLYIGFAWGIIYLCLEAVPLVMGNVYGFTAGQSGATFATIVIAAILGGFTNLLQERLYAKNVAKRGSEARLYLCMVGGLLFPSGIMIFAFSQGRGHWMGPCIGLVCLFSGIFHMYLAVFSYLADIYTLYASSALSGQSLCRNIAGCVFPLFTTQMYSRLGYQWASFLAACLGFTLSIVPFILFAYGPQIRARSRFGKMLEEMKASKALEEEAKAAGKA